MYHEEIKTKPWGLWWPNAESILSERNIEGAERGEFLYFNNEYMIYKK